MKSSLTASTLGICRPNASVCLALLLALLAGGSLLSPATSAADKNGDFALEGAGRATCSRFLTAVDEDSTEVLLFGGWLHGYITALNQLNEQTYDIVTWPSVQQQLQFLAGYCRENSKQRFFNAAAAMVEQMRPYRLQSRETLVQIPFSAGDGSVSVYPSTLRRVKESLSSKGFLDGSAPFTEVWDTTLETALKDFQRAKSLSVSGAPDSETLLLLLLR
ncbi:MAG: peptidoglycan-binding domain-containing protein [Congregibacter sp.]